MSTWNDTRSSGDGSAPIASTLRVTRWFATTVMVLGLAALVIPFGSMAARSPSSSPTLVVTFSTLAAATTADTTTPYVISGCGYDASLGNVTVVVNSPEATSWTGRTPDAKGCISVDNFSTQGAGSYKIQAWQHVHNKAVVVASTTFSL
jgi:hypothetical protein